MNNNIKMNTKNIFKKIICKTTPLSDNKKFKEFSTGNIRFENDLLFRNNDYICTIDVLDIDNKNQILKKIQQNYSNIAYISNYDTKKMQITLDIYFFPNNKRFSEVSLVFSDDILKSLVKKHLIKNTSADELNKFKKDFTLYDGYTDCFLFNIIYRNKGNLINIYTRTGLILTASYEDNSAVINKISNISQNPPALSLGYGELKFLPYKTIVSAKVQDILSKHEVYLNTWDKYSNLEGDILLKRVRDIGCIKVDNYEVDNRGLVLNLRHEKSIKSLSVGDQLILTENIPFYIINPDISWKEYREYNLENRQKKEKHPTVTVEHINYDTNSIVVSNDGLDIENKKFHITYKIDGDKSQIDRRENARTDILEGKCAMQTLGLILNGETDFNDLYFNQNTHKLEDIAISNYVKEKIFSKNPPTDTQLNAIKIALNTPDIAIIQGPPGTGKTTVITAIIEMLNELLDINDPYDSMAGQVLVTSFQHDAVENILSRLSVNSLPSIKFGSRSNSANSEFDMERIIKAWSYDTITKINSKHDNIIKSKLQSNFKNAYNTYIHTPSVTNALSLIEFAKEIVVNDATLSNDNLLLEEINSIIKSLTVDTNNKSEILNLVKCLRVTYDGFLDDGPAQARKVFNMLNPILDSNNKNHTDLLNVLTECYSCYNSDVSKVNILIKKTMKIRNYLIEKLTPKSYLVKEIPREDITLVYNKVKSKMLNFDDAKLNIVNEFLLELENNHTSIQKSLADYSFVYGATTQQTTMIKRKLIANNGEHDTVIVDEAARANPGDLLIPLTKASKRIILVGDHRQLPHIYDEEIAEYLKQTVPEFSDDLLKISMFEHLLNVAKKLELKDGIRRVITLDSQYRMHPVLGDFINDNFYSEKALGVDESFKSPLGVEFFTQELLPSPVNWINVPLSLGREEKFRKSIRRFAEVDIIVKKIREMISSEEGKNLTFGVISFYSAQVKAIIAALGDELNQRVRVGSVDAFQGMEFDVIFLSTVRTSDKIKFYLSQDLTELHDKIAIELFGFISTKNRLCVAMSRQKKLLILVGDCELFNNKIAQKYTTALYNYYNLCLENRGVLNE